GGDVPGADVVVADIDAALVLEQRIRSWPITATVLVQVLRSIEGLPFQQALDLESLAYATLQGGPEFAAWLRQRDESPLSAPPTGEAVLLSRDGAVVEAVLNRAADRNPISVEMRDALVEALSLLEADDSITELRLRGDGACFSIGGDLREFGTLPNPGTAHWVRTVQSPARLLAKLGARVTAHVHGACIGSGLELPAFAARVVAHRNTFFQMPELQLGLIPGAGGTLSITRRIGRQRLAWLVLSGRRINTRTALAWGLVDEVVH
ncbi:MAG: enoyl-CoA hydratase/isomerase family protein, partial [Bacteroidales bacterium]|nr:enoyl-CoA hydratase/isomerase family protein [Bacteroidales bacterium]